MIGTLALLCTLAMAPPPAPPLVRPTVETAPGPPAADSWYGLPALVSDMASATLLVSGLEADRDVRAKLLALGFTGFALGGPLNHLDHGQTGHALGSLGLRVAAGAVSIASVALAQGCFSDNPGSGRGCGLLIVSPLAVLGAMLVDDAFIAHEPAPPARVSWAPRLSAAPHGGLFSLGGSF